MTFRIAALLSGLILWCACSSGDYTTGRIPRDVQLDPGVLTVTVEEMSRGTFIVVVKIEGPVELEGAKNVCFWYGKKQEPMDWTFSRSKKQLFDEVVREYRFHIYDYGLSEDVIYGIRPVLEYENGSKAFGDVIYASPSDFPRPVPATPECRIDEDGAHVTFSSSLPEGMAGVRERGFCLTAPEKRPDGNTPRLAADGTGPGFSLTVDTLRRGILYHVWPYVQDAYGLRFGAYAPVRIAAPELAPVVRTLPGAGVYYTQVTAGGKLEDDKGGTVRQAGFQWGRSIADLESGPGLSYASSVGADGTFSAYKNVSAAGIWYYRAFVTTVYGTGYGEAMSVDVPDFERFLPVVATDARPVKNTASTVTVSGSVESDGGVKITERGFCHGTTSYPNESDKKVKVSGTTGKMTAVLEGVPMDQTYYYRAYAKNEAGTAYGEVRSVRIRSSDFEVTFRDLKAAVNSDGSVTFSVRIWNDRGQKFKERGFCWDYSSYSPPTVSDYKEKTGSSYGSGYEVKVSAYRFSGGKEYRVRAYVLTDDGVVWYSDKYDKVVFSVPDK